MNTVVVIEDQSTKQRLEQKPHPFGTKLDVPCLCSNLIRPLSVLGARSAARKWSKFGMRLRTRSNVDTRS